MNRPAGRTRSQSWDDRNDSHYLALYREKNKLRTVLALCFTQASETYHHWRIFGGGSGGVCISFKREVLLDAVKKQSGLRTGNVKYLKLTDMRTARPALQRSPFLKRYAFQHENEFRLIYESTSEVLTALDVQVSLACIDRVTLSPWIHKALSLHVKDVLKGIPGCADVEIVQSTLISNEEWKNLGESAT